MILTIYPLLNTTLMSRELKNTCTLLCLDITVELKATATALLLILKVSIKTSDDSPIFHLTLTF